MCKKPKISVVVPVYNAEKYLRRCVDSILSQTLTDFEILLINDGSTDSSGFICDEYKKSDKRVRVFHKENGGVSSARNVGLKNMRGEYSIHCDSDDWVDPNMYMELYNEAIQRDLDIVWCDFYRYQDGEKHQKIKCSQKCSPIKKRDVIKKLLTGEVHGATWNKLIKTKLILDNHINFPPGVNMWEDLFFSVSCFSVASKIGYLNKALYYYYRNADSICNSGYKNLKIKRDTVKVASLIDDQFDSKIFYKELSVLKLNSKFSLISNYYSFNPQKWRSLFPEATHLIFSNIKFGWYFRTINILALFKLDFLLSFVAYLVKNIKNRN